MVCNRKSSLAWPDPCSYPSAPLLQAHLNAAKAAQKKKKEEQAAAEASATAALVALADDEDQGGQVEFSAPAAKRARKGEVMCGACGRSSNEPWLFKWDGVILGCATTKKTTISMCEVSWNLRP